MVALARALRRWRCDSGAEFVEFALAFPLLLLVVMGIIDFGVMFQQYQVLTNAAREGARIAVLPAYCPDTATCDANVSARVNEYVNAGLLGLGGTVTVNPVFVSAVTVGGNCMNTATVTVSLNHQYLFLGGIISYFGGSFGSRTLNASSSMRSEVPIVACGP
jgi:Flp pilus assembly protein TadG